MRWWYHLIAAAIGLASAALIVFMVFGQASQQGSLGGESSSASARGGSVSLAAGCGSVAPVDVFEVASVSAARSSLPVIRSAGRRVIPKQSREIQWFSRLHAASGRCIHTVDMDAQHARIVLAYPQTTAVQDISSYVYAMLSKAFDPPYGRSRTQITISGKTARSVVVSARAWRTFQDARASVGLPASIAGLTGARSRFGYGDADIRIVGL